MFKLAFPSAQRLMALLVLATVVLLGGCISGGGSGGGSGDSARGVADTSGEVTLSWEPPETREDGAVFSPSEVDEYQVRYRREGGDYAFVDSPPEITNNTVSVNSLTPGEKYYFQVRVVDSNGLASNFSDEVSTVVN